MNAVERNQGRREYGENQPTDFHYEETMYLYKKESKYLTN